MHAHPGPAYGRRQDPHMIEMNEVAVQQPSLIGMDDNDATIANEFCFGAFANRQAVSSTIILPDHSCSCRWTGACVSLYYTITNPIASLLPQ